MRHDEIGTRPSLGTIATASTLIGALWLTGCCCTVKVVAHDSSGAAGERGAAHRNGDQPDDLLEVTEVDGLNARFNSVVTAEGQKLRLWVVSHDPSEPLDNKDPVHPAFRVHFHPDQPPQDLKVSFNSPAEVTFDSAAPASGWMYFSGEAPIGRTRRVKAVGSGTEFLIEITDTCDNIYMLGGVGDTVAVYSLLGATPDKPCQKLEFGQSMSVYENGDCSTPMGFVGTAGEAFVKKAMEEVNKTPWKR